MAFAPAGTLRLIGKEILAHRIFISRHKNSEFERKEFERIRALVEAHGFWPVDDHDISGADVNTVLRRVVSSCAGLIGICTPEAASKGLYPFVRLELETALDVSRPVLPVLYGDVEFPPSMSSVIRVVHDPENECDTYLQIGNVLGRWRSELGEDKPVLLKFNPADLGLSIRQIERQSRVQATLTKWSDPEIDRRQKCKLQATPAGFQVMVRGVQQDDQLQVRIVVRGMSWSSRFTRAGHLVLDMERDQ